MNRTILALLTLLCGVSLASAETGYDGWLRYAPLGDAARAKALETLPAVVVRLGDSAVEKSAAEELIRGVRGMTGRTLRLATKLPDEPAIVVGEIGAIHAADPINRLISDGYVVGADDGYQVQRKKLGEHDCLLISGGTKRGALYGVFALLRSIALHESLDAVSLGGAPYAPIRILNHWDNLNGSIERGYAGKSVFWDNDHITKDLGRIRDYARLMASIGINGCSVNNVNADQRVITPEYLREVEQVAAEFRKWGVKTYISLNFASPRDVGGVKTFDPLDPDAIAFWEKTIDTAYEIIPDLGGFVLKADSEGRLGPADYGRTPADAANAIARPLKKHGGILFYRGFVYNHRMDWRDPKNDRATAAYDNFHKLDGLFEDNVVIQIKNGPIDFQVREPASPLFSGLEKTNMAIELQITQEYLGQQKHLCYCAPMWKEVLDFDMQAKPEGSTVAELVAGRTFNRPTGGFVAVSNVGRDQNWLGHHLAMANFYAFGRLAWNPDLSSDKIVEEWTRLTFGHDPKVVETIVEMQMESWPTYERYSGPLGIGTLTDIIHYHFGPAPESSEYNGWGQWHRASDTGVGMDRTVETGTGYTAQYRSPIATVFESFETCPDDLLLFFHHVPYTHVLANGSTVIQYFYDAHYQGAEEAARFVDMWKSLRGKVDEQRYEEVLARQEFQAGHAIVWRDAICNWFHKKSGIDDAAGRVGNHPGRFEAEAVELDGYAPIDVTPWEAASGAKAVELPKDKAAGSITMKHAGPTGWYDLAIQYFDEEDGVSKLRLRVGEQLIDSWIADDHVPTPSALVDAHTSTRRTIRGVALRPGDLIRIEAEADGGERAAIDYIEVTRQTE